MTRPNLAKLSSSEQDTYRRALDAVSLMRRNRSYSLARAARESGTSPATVKRYAGAALTKRRTRYRAKETDRLRRELVFYDSAGQRTVITHSSKGASEISAYHNAVRSFVIYGDDTALRRYEGKQIVVGGVPHTYLTDRRALSRLARAGELNFLDIYKN